ncbi:hypothetical protein KL939_003724 [Ogataea angusta]|nr:hypothetical protein KL939_003724 [Ogataea angusta]
MFSRPLRTTLSRQGIRAFSASRAARQVVEVNSLAEFKENVLSQKAAFVDFYASWCAPCKTISPVVEKLSETHKDVKFFKVDVDNAQDVAMEYGISAMPTFITFKDGVKDGQFVGASPQAIQQLVVATKQ